MIPGKLALDLANSRAEKWEARYDALVAEHEALVALEQAVRYQRSTESVWHPEGFGSTPVNVVLTRLDAVREAR